MLIIPRQEWAPDGRPPAWKSDGKTPRPALVLPLRLLIVHYAGSPDGFPPGNQFLSVSSPAYMRGMFTWAFDNDKGDEYNYVIAGPTGIVYEWAGTKQAAHCSGKNTTSIGVQFGLDVDDVPPVEYAARLLDLRQHLVAAGVLTRDHAVDQHGQHFTTGCPGDLVKARWPLYDVPLPSSPTKPAPTPTKEDAVFVSVTGHPRHPDILVVYERAGRDCYVHVSGAEAERIARWRSGTDVKTWAESQPRVPYSEIQPYLAEA